MTISAAIYARTSPDCLVTADQQVEHLRAMATEHGWAVAGVFIDRPTTVKKGRERRPGETALRDAIRHGHVQKVLIWSIDRIGRSLEELVRFLEMCRTCRCIALVRRAEAGHGSIERSVNLQFR